MGAGIGLIVDWKNGIGLRQRLHGTGSVWNRYEIGTDKTWWIRCDQICYLAPNVSTYQGNPIWNRTVPVSNRSLVNRVDPYHSGSDPKPIGTYPIQCKRSFNGTELNAGGNGQKLQNGTETCSFSPLFGTEKCSVVGASKVSAPPP